MEREKVREEKEVQGGGKKGRGDKRVRTEGETG